MECVSRIRTTVIDEAPSAGMKTFRRRNPRASDDCFKAPTVDSGAGFVCLILEESPEYYQPAICDMHDAIPLRRANAQAHSRHLRHSSVVPFTSQTANLYDQGSIASKASSKRDMSSVKHDAASTNSSSRLSMPWNRIPDATV